MRGILPLLTTGYLAGAVVARDVPANVKNLYNSIRAQGSCKNILKGGFYSQEKDSKGTLYYLASCGHSIIGCHTSVLLLKKPVDTKTGAI
jgi:hypothetical protein